MPSSESTIRTRFRRYECKYVVSEETAAAVSRYIRPYVAEDPYAKDSPDRSYDIMSLYMDSPDLRLFRETEEGLLDRIKLRIRRYDYELASNAFLEIKRRHNRLVTKDRARMSTSAVEYLLAGGAPDMSNLPDGQRASYDAFTEYVARWMAGPVVWVKYRREAWAGAFNDRLRITMDRDLCCAGLGPVGIFLPPNHWTPLPVNGVVLELKFDEAFPDWLSGMVRTLNLTQQSFSKYARSVKVKTLPPF
jgi:hypothetical protein